MPLRARIAVLEVFRLRLRGAGVAIAQLRQRLEGTTRWSRRRCRRLARAPWAVARPSTRGSGGAPSGLAQNPQARPEEGEEAELGYRQAGRLAMLRCKARLVASVVLLEALQLVEEDQIAVHARRHLVGVRSRARARAKVRVRVGLALSSPVTPPAA